LLHLARTFAKRIAERFARVRGAPAGEEGSP